MVSIHKESVNKLLNINELPILLRFKRGLITSSILSEVSPNTIAAIYE